MLQTANMGMLLKYQLTLGLWVETAISTLLNKSVFIIQVCNLLLSFDCHFCSSARDTGEEGVLSTLWQRYDHTMDKVLSTYK